MRIFAATQKLHLVIATNLYWTILFCNSWNDSQNQL